MLAQLTQMQKTIREQEEKLNSQAQTFKEKEEMMKREENEKLELLKQEKERLEVIRSQKLKIFFGPATLKGSFTRTAGFISCRSVAQFQNQGNRSPWFN